MVSKAVICEALKASVTLRKPFGQNKINFYISQNQIHHNDVIGVTSVTVRSILSLVTLHEMDLGLYIKIRTFLCLFSCSSLLTTFGVKLCFVTWSQPHVDSFDNPMQLENPAFVHLFLPL